MARYRKKPVVIEAVQWNGRNFKEIAAFCDSEVIFDSFGECIFIETLEGEMRASVGDFIIKGVKGEFYPCKPDVFERTYEEC